MSPNNPIESSDATAVQIADAVVQAMWQRDQQAQQLGIEVTRSGVGSVTLEMPIDERHLGGHEFVHGGVLFTLADVAMSYASNTSDIHAMATAATIQFIDSARPGERLIAEANECNLRGKVGIWDATVRSKADGRMVATFRGTTLQVGGSVINLQAKP